MAQLRGGPPLPTLLRLEVAAHHDGVDWGGWPLDAVTTVEVVGMPSAGATVRVHPAVSDALRTLVRRRVTATHLTLRRLVLDDDIVAFLFDWLERLADSHRGVLRLESNASVSPFATHRVCNGIVGCGHLDEIHGLTYAPTVPLESSNPTVLDVGLSSASPDDGKRLWGWIARSNRLTHLRVAMSATPDRNALQDLLPSERLSFNPLRVLCLSVRPNDNHHDEALPEGRAPPPPLFSVARNACCGRGCSPIIRTPTRTRRVRVRARSTVCLRPMWSASRSGVTLAYPWTMRCVCWVGPEPTPC